MSHIQNMFHHSTLSIWPRCRYLICSLLLVSTVNQSAQHATCCTWMGCSVYVGSLLGFKNPGISVSVRMFLLTVSCFVLFYPKHLFYQFLVYGHKPFLYCYNLSVTHHSKLSIWSRCTSTKYSSHLVSILQPPHTQLTQLAWHIVYKLTTFYDLTVFGPMWMSQYTVSCLIILFPSPFFCLFLVLASPVLHCRLSVVRKSLLSTISNPEKNYIFWANTRLPFQLASRSNHELHFPSTKHCESVSSTFHTLWFWTQNCPKSLLGRYTEIVPRPQCFHFTNKELCKPNAVEDIKTAYI